MPILICIISAFFWAAFDLTRKLTLKRINSKTLLLTFTLAQLVFFIVWISVDTFNLKISEYVLPGTILICISVISALFFLKAIKQSDLSLTIPLLSLSPLFSSIFSLIFLNEKLSSIQYFGVFLIIIGTLILYSKRVTLFEVFRSFRIIANNHSARLMILVSIMWSITPVLDKLCLKNSSINIHGFIQSTGMLFFLIFLIAKNKDFERKSLRKNWKTVFLTILIGLIASILQFYAILSNYVPIMESIKRSIGQVSSVFLGNFFFKEKITKPKVFGVTILSIGVYLIIDF